jgi:transposase
MEINKLKEYLAEGLSLNKIRKKEGKSLSSVRYWMKVHELKPNFKNFGEDPHHKTQIVDGKKRCAKCKEWKPHEEFGTKGKYKQGYCPPCLYRYQASRWEDRKKKAVELMGGKCIKCGYCKNYAALDFHHIDPFQKEFDFNVGRRRSWDKLIVELKKCILLCSNCHREEHHPNTTVSEKIPESNPSLNLESLKPTGTCLICGTEVFGTKYCSRACSCDSQRRVKRPNREELVLLIETTSFVQIGKRYGVSDNSIRKWADHYGLNWKTTKK